MKATLSFNLPEEQDDFDIACKATKMSIALFEIRQQVFRPARKHGYADKELQDLIEKSPEARLVVEKLEKLFSEICEENEVLELTWH